MHYRNVFDRLADSRISSEYRGVAEALKDLGCPLDPAHTLDDFMRRALRQFGRSGYCKRSYDWCKARVFKCALVAALMFGAAWLYIMVFDAAELSQVQRICLAVGVFLVGRHGSYILCKVFEEPKDPFCSRNVVVCCKSWHEHLPLPQAQRKKVQYLAQQCREVQLQIGYIRVNGQVRWRFLTAGDFLEKKYIVGMWEVWEDPYGI